MHKDLQSILYRDCIKGLARKLVNRVSRHRLRVDYQVSEDCGL